MTRKTIDKKSARDDSLLRIQLVIDTLNKGEYEENSKNKAYYLQGWIIGLYDVGILKWLDVLKLKESFEWPEN